MGSEFPELPAMDGRPLKAFLALVLAQEPLDTSQVAALTRESIRTAQTALAELCKSGLALASKAGRDTTYTPCAPIIFRHTAYMLC